MRSKTGDKPGNQNNAVANNLSHQLKPTEASSSLQELIKNSPQTKQLRAYQAMANDYIKKKNVDPVQRIETGDRHNVSNGWTRIMDGTGDWMALVENQVVVVLVPTTDFDAANENPINDVALRFKEKGCAICVAADFLNTSAVALGNMFKNAPVEIQRAYQMIYTVNGYGEQVELIYNHLKILPSNAVENFDNYDTMMASFTDEDPEWSAGLAWDGHIIRASGEGRVVKFWDPQRGTSEAAVPRGIPLTLIYLEK